MKRIKDENKMLNTYASTKLIGGIMLTKQYHFLNSSLSDMFDTIVNFGNY